MGRLLLFDALAMKFTELKLRKDKNCPICGDNPTIKELIDYEQFCGIVPQETSSADEALEIDVSEVKKMLDSGKNFKLIDVRDPLQRPEPPDPDEPPAVVIGYYWDKIRQGIPKDEAAELAVVFWRTMYPGG